MAILPQGPGFTSVKLTSVDPTLVSESHGGVQFVRKIKGHRWAVDIEWPRMNEDDARAIFAFIASQRGRLKTFDVVSPSWSKRGVGTGAVVVSGGGQTGGTLVTSGWQPSTPGVMVEGDLFRLTANGKVYMVTAAADSDATGLATLTFFPDLVVSPADGESVVHDDVTITCRSTADSIQYTRRGRLYRISGRFIEAIS